jgi:hypothetical protein
MRVISLSLSLSLVQAHFTEFFFGEDGRRTIRTKKQEEKKRKFRSHPPHKPRLPSQLE